MARIELRHLSKQFGATTAVDDVSFDIEDGEFFVLVGPSGCGKSTLLNMIVGLEEVTAGEILVDGARVDQLDPKDRNMAMVFQSYAIYPHMSVRENMAFPLKLARLPPAEIATRVTKAARILELEELLDRKPRALSGGQRQRVAMGRAIVREPKVFLLDEPLSNLDARLRAQMRTEIARLQRRLGTTTVYVTHDQTEAMTLGDRIAVLRKGKVLQIGTPRELYEHPRDVFIAGFIGAPAMNFLPARATDRGLALPIGTLVAPVHLPATSSAPLLAGFRPDALVVCSEERRGGLRFDVRAKSVEWLGADAFVHFDIGLEGFGDIARPAGLESAWPRRQCRCSLVARVDPAAGLRVGDRVRLWLAAEQVQLFDAESGQNLAPTDGRSAGG